jgi:hypothetical protein
LLGNPEFGEALARINRDDEESLRMRSPSKRMSPSKRPTQLSDGHEFVRHAKTQILVTLNKALTQSLIRCHRITLRNLGAMKREIEEICDQKGAELVDMEGPWIEACRGIEEKEKKGGEEETEESELDAELEDLNEDPNQYDSEDDEIDRLILPPPPGSGARYFNNDSIDFGLLQSEAYDLLEELDKIKAEQEEFEASGVEFEEALLREEREERADVKRKVDEVEALRLASINPDDPSEEEVVASFEAMDHDNSGFISRHEFREYLQSELNEQERRNTTNRDLLRQNRGLRTCYPSCSEEAFRGEVERLKDEVERLEGVKRSTS